MSANLVPQVMTVLTKPSIQFNAQVENTVSQGRLLVAHNVQQAMLVTVPLQILNLALMVYISVRTNQHSQKWNDKFTKVVTSIPEILEVNRMSGDLDYLLKAVVSDMAGYDVLYKKLIAADIFDISSSFVMEEIKTTTELPLGFITDRYLKN